jgi:RNA polymerase sigma factor (sigma-70 family)
MENARDQADDAAFRDCQRIVRALSERFGWALLREDDLAGLVLGSIQSEASPAEVERLTKHHYAIALYEACWQISDPARRERGYYELHRFLFRAAHNRWPELAEDATQRALLLVYEQIDRCQSQGTFLAFALYKLWQAFKDEQRARGQDVPLEELELSRIERARAATDPPLVQLEGAQQLLDGILRLSNALMQKSILLKYVHGLSDSEIGELLGITPGYVRVLRCRGIALLRRDEQLEAYFKEPTNEGH